MSALSSRHGAWVWLTVVCSGAWLIGCDAPLKSVSLIQETRVLGARVEVDGEPTRSSPRPGERASVRFFVAGPGGPPSVAFALSVCAVSPTNYGFPNCVGPELGSVTQAEPVVTMPTLAFEIPQDLDLIATPHGFVSGTIDGGDVAFEFELGSAQQDNNNPQFTADSLAFDGQPWPPSDASAACSDGLTQVAANSVHQLSIALTESDFDTLAQTTPLDPTRETLLLSQFSDAGELDHAFTSLSPNSTESGDARWTGPPVADAPGSVARFYFVVRDSRGGEDFTTRALCVTP
jgi:hypothetical protein